MKLTSVLAISLAATLGAAALGHAQDASPPMATPGAPQNPAMKSPDHIDDGSLRAGHNSFTRGQARERIRKAGYSDVTGLTKGPDGLWQATAMKDGQKISVSLDFKGNVSAR